MMLVVEPDSKVVVFGTLPTTSLHRRNDNCWWWVFDPENEFRVTVLLFGNSLRGDSFRG